MIDKLWFRVWFGSTAGFGISCLLCFFLLNHLLEVQLTARIDEELRVEALNVAASLANSGPPFDPEVVEAELTRLGHTYGIERRFFRLFSKSGAFVAGSNLNFWPDHRDTELPPDALNGPFFDFRTSFPPGRAYGVRTVLFNDPDGFILEMGSDLGEIGTILGLGKWIYGLTMLVVIGLGSFFGWLLTHRPLHHILVVSQAAGRITRSTDFRHRVELPTGSRETDLLAGAFNTMLDKIQALIQGQKEIMDNIAHDIRSPVARMRSGAETALLQKGNDDLAGQVIEDCDHILNLVNTLLEISATETGIVQWEKSLLRADEIIGDAVELFSPLIEAKKLDLTLNLQEKSLIEADPRVLQRVVANLIDNAIKYTPEGGAIEIALETRGQHLRLKVKDNGQGIARGDIQWIFDRFFRGDASRTMPGSGLGLSFCRAAVEAMGGRIECSSQEGVGTLFTVFLPGYTNGTPAVKKTKAALKS